MQQEFTFHEHQDNITHDRDGGEQNKYGKGESTDGIC